ncbi:MAG TPA: oleate hydratase [Puia sp.]|jgi:oleate hydratase|nr:oleate hydratase [Puia sp.]
MATTTTRKAWLAGGGIASLAAAAFMIRDGNLPGKNIMILERSALPGGSLDASGSADTGYVMRGGRMLNFTYRCTYDLLSAIPSLSDPSISVYQEIIDFNNIFKTYSRARLVDKDRKIVNVSSPGLKEKDRIDLVGLIAKPEGFLGRKRIEDWFSPSFFRTNFWWMWSSMFAFQPWHSLVEFRRYLIRFIHEFPRIDTLAGVDRTPYNQFDSIVQPLMKWLKEQGVLFIAGAEVFDLDMAATDGVSAVTHIRLMKDGEPECISVAAEDLVFLTLGSMTASSTLGAMDRPAILHTDKRNGCWALWKTLAKRSPALGHPENFDSRIDESKWMSFTVTCKDPFFFDWMEKFSRNKAGSGGLVTFKDSSWLFSVVLARQPHFINQPEGVTVFWGYGLYPDKPGDYVPKKMIDCTGAEILTELLSHLRLTEQLPLMLATSVCIPCMMPYITSEFLTREEGDRPAIIPKGFSNLALLGQFTEMEEDVVFTVEYSVRSAQQAVYEKFGLDKKPPDIYKGQHDLQALYDAVKTMHR